MDDYGLRNKVALIAGGGSRDDGIGNGRGAAILLARTGAKVAVMDQDLEAAETTVAMIRCLLYTSPSPRDLSTSRMPSSA